MRRAKVATRACTEPMIRLASADEIGRKAATHQLHLLERWLRKRSVLAAELRIGGISTSVALSHAADEAARRAARLTGKRARKR